MKCVKHNIYNLLTDTYLRIEIICIVYFYFYLYNKNYQSNSLIGKFQSKDTQM